MDAGGKLRREQGARLRLAREAAGFKSARAAAMANDWAESSYRAHESGTRTIGQDDAEAYARRFRASGADVSASEILFGGRGTSQVRRGAPATGGAGNSDDADQLTPDHIEMAVNLSAYMLETQVSAKIAEAWRELVREAARNRESNQRLQDQLAHQKESAAKRDPAKSALRSKGR
jgi:hypothetical protein